MSEEITLRVTKFNRVHFKDLNLHHYYDIEIFSFSFHKMKRGQAANLVNQRESWLYKRSGLTTKVQETSSAVCPLLQSHSSATLMLCMSLRSTPLWLFLFGSLTVVGFRTTTYQSPPHQSPPHQSPPHQSLVTCVDVTLVVTFLSLHIRDPSTLWVTPSGIMPPVPVGGTPPLGASFHPCKHNRLKFCLIRSPICYIMLLNRMELPKLLTMNLMIIK